MVGRREGELRIAYRQTAPFQLHEAGRAAQVMDQVPVDVQQRPVVRERLNDMGIPYLGEERLALHHTAFRIGRIRASPPPHVALTVR